MTEAQDTQSAINRRQFRRIARAIHVRVRVKRLPQTDLKSQTIDMSAGGVQIEVNTSLPIGTEMGLSFRGLGAGEDMEVSATVAWCTQSPSGSHSVGVSFVGMTPAKQEMLLILISREKWDPHARDDGKYISLRRKIDARFIKADSAESRGQCSQLSVRGMVLYTQDPVAAGAMISLDLDLPNSTSGSMKCQGEVRECVPARSGDMWRATVEFVSMTDEMRLRLVASLANELDSPLMARLVKVRGKLKAESVLLPLAGEYLIGRSDTADLQILDEGISRNHCAVECRDSTYYVHDLGSRNGTWLNGEHVKKKALQPGDRIAVGSTELEFALDQEAPEEQPVAEQVVREFKKRLDLDQSSIMAVPPEHRSVESLTRAQRSLSAIYEIGNVINAERDPNRLYERTLDAIFKVVSPDRAFLILVSRDGEDLKIAAQRKGGSSAYRASFSQTVAWECVRQGVSVLRLNAMMDEQFGKALSVIEQRIHSVLCAPIESTDRVLGAVYVDRTSEGSNFSQQDMELLAAVGKQAGIAIERVSFMGQLQRMLYRSVRALVATIEAKDSYTKGHSERVTAYALKLARKLGVAGDEYSNLELASLLHDVGKIGVEDAVLRKPGKLSDEEYNTVRQHPAVGSQIVRNVEDTDVLASIVRHHHERWDGNGYPDRLAGTAIPWLARILCAADAYDAMASSRPYRDGLSHEAIVEEFQKGRGSQWDPQVSEALLRELDRGPLGFE